MNRKLIIFGLLILVLSVVLKLVITGIRGVKVDEFKPVAVMFLVDTSASNREGLPEQRKFMRQMCGALDPEDQVKIMNVSEDAYLIYEGSPHNGSTIKKSMDAYTQFDKESFGTAYGTALKKAFGHAFNMKKAGYTPAIVVFGDLQDEGALEGQINWDLLPKNVENAKKYVPGISMSFLFAHPSRLDYVKEKLVPVLGEKKIIIASDKNVEKSLRKFTAALGR